MTLRQDGRVSARLDTGASATVDAAGRAEVVLGPVPPGVRWMLQRLAVRLSSSSATSSPEVRVYTGPERADGLLDGTYSGAQDFSDFGGDGLQLDTGDYLTVVWTGADVGVVGTATIAGRVLGA